MPERGLHQQIPERNAEWRGQFDIPTWTQVPDILITHWMPQLSGSELKVALYVVRYTFGYHRESATISFDRFLNGTFRQDGARLDWGAGVKRTQLKGVLPALVESGILIRERRHDRLGGDAASSYALNLRGEELEAGPKPAGYRAPAAYAFTPIPNQVFDALLPHLKEVELKALLYITHHTTGLKKRHADISRAQMIRGTVASDGRIMDRGAGITERSLDIALRGLIEKHVIFREQQFARDGGALPTRYGLNVLPEASPPPADSDLLAPVDVDQVSLADTNPGGGANPGPPVPVSSEPHERHDLKIHERRVQQQTKDDLTRKSEVVVALTNLGISPNTARNLASQHTEELIREQIDMLPYRRANDPAAVLVKAIREEWAAPASYQSPEQREAEVKEAERTRAELDAWREVQMLSKEREDSTRVPARRQSVEFRPFQGVPLDSRRAWATALMSLKNQGEAEAYLSGTQLLARNGDELVVGTRTLYAAEWLQRRVAHKAAQVLSVIGGEQVTVHFVAQTMWLSQG